MIWKGPSIGKFSDGNTLPIALGSILETWSGCRWNNCVGIAHLTPCEQDSGNRNHESSNDKRGYHYENDQRINLGYA